jgi:phage protein D
MIFKSAFPNSPTVNMLIDGVEVDYTAINSVHIMSAENEHDYAELHVSGLIPKFVTEYINRPVFLSIEYSPTQRTSFYGYVAFVEPKAVTRRGLINRSPIQSAIISCFGASYDMKPKKSRVWERVTIRQVVTKISDEYKYSCQVPNNPYIFSRLTQSHESDVEFLVRVCTSQGYKVSITGSHIHVYDPFKAVSRNMPYAELTTLSDNSVNAQFAPGRVMEFEGTFGSNTPYGSSNNYVIETLDNDGNLIKYKTGEESMGLGTPLPARFTDSVPINAVSLSAVQSISGAKLRNRTPFHAQVTTTGIPEVKVGALVRLNKYDSKFDGFWMVSKISQRVTRANYVTELSIVRDSTTNSEPIVSSGLNYVVPDEPIIVNEMWVSSDPKVSVYA